MYTKCNRDVHSLTSNRRRRIRRVFLTGRRHDILWCLAQYGEIHIFPFRRAVDDLRVYIRDIKLQGSVAARKAVLILQVGGLSRCIPEMR